MAYRGNMKYFKLINRENHPFPRIINWNHSLDIRKLNRRDYQSLPPFILLNMETGLDAFLPDILISPFLLVSRNVMEVIALYDSDIPFRFAALFDTEHGESAGYYCPILAEEECVAADISSGRGELRLDRERMTDLPLFLVRRGDRRETLLRLDLAESLLGREATGIELQEVCLAE
ncbi:hypothetical protein ADH76_31635 [Enterocloster clostridioformis]|uniref:hypothetical protein n=1 Tax=Enterocloster clostridioformis TaxID=1531 RepID=UPI00080C74C8|nr:hypothetical protein [Enterocloster clostridioformis]ANU46799.1 hypothetical protein A4V08_14255 [Lachnoclostridium sp. YL32]NDO26870.1 hypothetical protein [Enterocloster clostridioformis]OXE62390.1 hypothetical protein ADH76_31635 [Enterocloster clostridioformis]QQQ98495.1 hypothetical protein I5Q83_20340 [Enterocloster clostridioformis]